MADAPGTSCIDPPRVKIHASSTERQRLFKALDDAGRLGFIGASEALHGYQSGLFAILKDLTTDRLIFDSRPFNCLERPPRRWVFSSAHAMNLCDIQLPSDAVLVCSGTDLRDFYYSFQIGHQRLVRNTLPHRMSVREARRFKCFDARLANEAYVYPALRSLAMGDTCAVELAQTSHVAWAVRAGLVEAATLMAMHLPIPRGPRMTGIVIDDLINLEIITREALLSAEQCQSAQDVARMLEIYKKKGLIPHEKKTFFGQTVADFWGATVDGVTGSVRASLSRVIPIAAATELVLRIGVCSAGLLEILVGCWTATFLFRRRLLCLLGVVYEPLQRGLTRKSVFKLSPQLKEELILCITLAPLTATDLRAKNSEYVYCSDASDTGLGITKAPLPPSLQSEVHRHRMRKGAWVKLLSPLRKLQRMKGLLPPAEELPMGQVLPSHPLWMVLGGALQYTEVWKQRVSKPTHINILELRALVRMESEASREGFNLRVFSLCDSQVALGCWVKGRASSFSLNQELQQSLAVHLGCNVQSNAGFLPTEFNSSDGPSRGRAVDSPTLPLPSWWEELPCLDAFDSWLQEYGTDPYTLSGLPPFDELYEEVSACPRRLREAAVLTRECEARTEKQPAGRTPGPLEVQRQPAMRTQEPVNSERQSARRTPEPRESMNQPGHGPQEPCRPLDPKPCCVGPEPSAKQLGRTLLSGSARELLGAVPSWRYVLPRDWTVGERWVPDFAGCLDLFSGQKGAAKALAMQARTWVLAFDIGGVRTGPPRCPCAGVCFQFSQHRSCGRSGIFPA